MQPKDVDAFHRLVEKGNAQDPAGKLLVEEVDGWQVMGTDQASIDAYKSAVALDGPVLADDESFSQAMDDYDEASLIKAYLSGATVMDEVRKSLSKDQADFVGKIGNLDWIAGSAARDRRGRPLRHDGPRHAGQADALVDRLRDPELRALSCQTSCPRTCSPTSASTARRARSRASRTTRS